jgi:hypothetical protein
MPAILALADSAAMSSPRIFAGNVGSMGRTPSSPVELIEANVPPEELARRAAELRKRELLELGDQGFAIGLPDDFDADTYAPWWVRTSDQTVWKRESGSPPAGYLPNTHCVVVVPGGGWYYLTAAHATGDTNPPRSVAELEQRKGRRSGGRRSGRRSKRRRSRPRRRRAGW